MIASTMEGESLVEHMRREQTSARIAEFQKQGLGPKDAARLADLAHAQEHGELSADETEERAAIMEKLRTKEKGSEPTAE